MTPGHHSALRSGEHVSKGESTTHHCGDPTRIGDSVAVITSGEVRGAAWLHLVPERDCVRWAGLSVTVRQTIQTARMPSNTACYRAKLLGFHRWYKQKSLNSVIYSQKCPFSSGVCYTGCFTPILCSCYEGIGNWPIIGLPWWSVFLRRLRDSGRWHVPFQTNGSIHWCLSPWCHIPKIIWSVTLCQHCHSKRQMVMWVHLPGLSRCNMTLLLWSTHSALHV